MSEQEFELYLKLLSRCLGLTPGQREQIADELRDHLEQRLAELEQAGVARDKAVVQALDEFGDAAVLAANFAAIARLKRRRFLMRLSLGSVGALTAVLLIAYAFWPDNRAVRGPERVVAQEKPGSAVPQKPADVKSSTPGVASTGSPKSTRRFPPAVLPIVEVCRPVTKEVTDYAAFSGTVQPSQMVQIRTRATGYLRKISFRPGQVVKPGDLLFEIDPATYQVDVDKAKAEVQRAEAKVKFALARAAHLKQQQASGQGTARQYRKSTRASRNAKSPVPICKWRGRTWNRRCFGSLGPALPRQLAATSAAQRSTSAAWSGARRVSWPRSSPSIRSTFPSRWISKPGLPCESELIARRLPQARRPRLRSLRAIGGNRQGFLEFVEDADFSVSGETMVRARVPNQDAALVSGLFVTVRYEEGKPHAALLIPRKALAETAMRANGGRNLGLGSWATFHNIETPALGQGIPVRPICWPSLVA